MMMAAIKAIRENQVSEIERQTDRQTEKRKREEGGGGGIP